MRSVRLVIAVRPNHSYLNMPDGMPGVWIGKIKGAKNIASFYLATITCNADTV